MNKRASLKLIRVGVFDTVQKAQRAIVDLLAAGFRKDELAVICSNKYKDRYFSNVPTSGPGSTHATEGAVVGGVTGAAIGGLLLAASAIATGGATLLIAGPALVGGSALAGSFTGIMATRG